jgi:hypothetical protein
LGSVHGELKTESSKPGTVDAKLRSHKAHFPAPILGVFEKINNLLAGAFREVAFAEARVEHIVLISEHVQRNVIFCEIVSSLMLI